MSHFTVLVVTDTPDDVENALQPFHEYECTGIKDEYVKFVPAEESLEEMRAKHTRCLAECPDSTSEDFDEFMNSWYGYNKEDGVWGRVANPNAKWDWWKIGGRWAGFFIPKNPDVGIKGKAGLLGSEMRPDGVDQTIKSNIDFERMYSEAVDNAAEFYDKAMKIIDGREYKTWDQVRQDIKDIDKARDFYHSQPVIEDLKKMNDWPFFDASQFAVDRDFYIQDAKEAAVSTFAILIDGKWLERGNMGWWCSVTDKDDEYSKKFFEILDSIPDDKFLTVVDCHI